MIPVRFVGMIGAVLGTSVSVRYTFLILDSSVDLHGV